MTYSDAASVERCKRCGWPICETIEEGCTADNRSCRCDRYPNCSCGYALGAAKRAIDAKDTMIGTLENRIAAALRHLAPLGDLQIGMASKAELEHACREALLAAQVLDPVPGSGRIE